MSHDCSVPASRSGVAVTVNLAPVNLEAVESRMCVRIECYRVGRDIACPVPPLTKVHGRGGVQLQWTAPHNGAS